MNNQVIAETTFGQISMAIFSDMSISINGDKFDSEFMSKANDETKGMNRIYKPIPLLFWIDVKNGKLSNWK